MWAEWIDHNYYNLKRCMVGGRHNDSWKYLFLRDREHRNMLVGWKEVWERKRDRLKSKRKQKWRRTRKSRAWRDNFFNNLTLTTLWPYGILQEFNDWIIKSFYWECVNWGFEKLAKYRQMFIYIPWHEGNFPGKIQDPAVQNMYSTSYFQENS